MISRKIKKIIDSFVNVEKDFLILIAPIISAKEVKTTHFVRKLKRMFTFKRRYMIYIIMCE